MLATPPTQRKQEISSLCELVVIISGLAMSVPLMCLRHPLTAATDKGWDLPPTVEDGMDALAAVNFWMFMCTALSGIMLPLFCALSGLDHFRTFEKAIVWFSAMMMLFDVSIFTLAVLMAWSLFTNAQAPYMMLVALVLWVLMLSHLFYISTDYLVEALPLELYHMPRCGKLPIALWYLVIVPSPSLWSRLSREALRAAAEKRAAELRARCGLGPPATAKAQAAAKTDVNGANAEAPAEQEEEI